jgi:acyl-CoA thioesterase
VPAAQSVESSVQLDPTWEIGGNPHGGYLLRHLAASALDEEHPDPLAVSAHFLSPPKSGPVVVQATRLRTGRRVATTATQLSSTTGVHVAALVTASRVGDSDEPARFSRPPLEELPAPEDCPRAPSEAPTNDFRVGHLDHVDVRWDPACLGWVMGKPSGQAEFRGWIRRDDQRDADLLDLLVFADSMAPTTYDVGIAGWAPTLELSVLLRARPAPGWLQIRQRTTLIAGGWLDEDCDIWDSTGRLVAQARQLAGYREG